MKLKFKKLTEDAILPRFAHEGDAGLDIAAVEECVIEAGKTAIVKTGIAVELPKRYEIQVRPRSGLAAKFAVTTLNSPGTIDSNYRGEIRVILINHGGQDFLVEKGMRIAQLIVGRLPRIKIQEVKSLTKSQREDRGFGSSGLK